MRLYEFLGCDDQSQPVQRPLQMYRSFDYEQAELNVNLLRLELQQLTAEIEKLRADAANELAQARQRRRSIEGKE